MTASISRSFSSFSRCSCSSWSLRISRMEALWGSGEGGLWAASPGRAVPPLLLQALPQFPWLLSLICLGALMSMPHLLSTGEVPSIIQRRVLYTEEKKGESGL